MIRGTDFLAAPAPDVVPWVYIITGEEEFLRTSCREKILESLGDDVDVTHLVWGEGEASPLDAATILDELRYQSLFGGRRAVVLSNARSFLIDERIVIQEFATNETLSAVLILEDSAIASIKGKRVSWVKAAETLIKGGAVAINCTPLKATSWNSSGAGGTEATRFLQEQASVLGKTLEPDAALALHEAEGSGLRGMVSQLEKLVVAIGDRESISIGDVEGLVGKTRTASIFELIDAFGARDWDVACRSINQVYSQGLTDQRGKKSLDSTALTARIIPMIESRLHELGRVFELMREGQSWDEAAVVVFGQHRRWAFSRFQRQLQARKPRELGAAVCDLCDVDLGLKSGGDPETLLTEFIVRHCAPAG